MVSFPKTRPNTTSCEIQVVLWREKGVTFLACSSRRPIREQFVEKTGRSQGGKVKKRRIAYTLPLRIPLANARAMYAICFSLRVNLAFGKVHTGTQHQNPH